jgi:hypothetical protein
MHLLAEKQTPSEYVGHVCSVSTKSENQGSVHPGNNLIVASGSDQVVLSNVERAAGVVTNASGTLTLGDNITVTLELGQDKVFSAGMSVSFECEPEEEPEPINVCRDGEVVEIFPEDRLNSDTELPCPVDEPEVLGETLPKTGPGSTAFMTLAAGSLAYVVTKRFAKEQ